jgi:pimeloyl-ACP methyl ester carboxylesterase
MKNLIMALMAMLCLSRTMAQTSPCEDSRLNIYGLCIEPERDKNGDVIDYTSVFSETHLAHQEVHFHVSPLLEENGSTFIDFDNGQGFQPYSIASMSPKIVIYATSGAKTIRFENIDGSDTTRWSKQLSILDNGSYAYTAPDDIWTFETGDFTPPCSNAYPNNHPYSQTAKAKGRAYIKYADASNPVLRNPVVFVEGFDFFKEAYFDPQTGDTIRFGRIGWDVMTRGLSNGTGEQIFREMPIQINDFQLNGYDLVYLDIEDGTDYIQRSALLVMQLLDEINAKKACDGEEIVVIGASMGGQVVRYALTKMEQENRYHGVRTYVSFDAPHQGAVVPMSVQSAIWGLAHLSHPSNIDENTTKLWDGLNSPAARQMLYETFLGEVKAGNVTSAMNIVDISGNPQGPGFPIGWFSPMSLDYDCLRDGFVAERAALGYPKYTRNIALVNGSKQAVTQDFNQWDKLVRAETIIGTLVPFRLILKPTPNTP